MHILSYNRYARFVIIKNGSELSRVHIRRKLRSTEDDNHRGTGIIAVQSDVNDTFNIKAGYYGTQVYGR